MDKHTVITIGRQFGSGGREIGYSLAKRLNIKCYDKELLAIAAKDSGLCEQIFELHDEKPTNSLLYSLVMDTYSTGYNNSGAFEMPINQKVFLAQFETIKKIAKSESCIIIGRCADYALENELDYYSIFINSDIKNRVSRISQKYGLPENKAKDLVVKTDKKRANYYNYYTNKKWGSSDSYDLCINSGRFGIEKTVDIIINLLDL